MLLLNRKDGSVGKTFTLLAQETEFYSPESMFFVFLK